MTISVTLQFANISEALAAFTKLHGAAAVAYPVIDGATPAPKAEKPAPKAKATAPAPTEQDAPAAAAASSLKDEPDAAPVDYETVVKPAVMRLAAQEGGRAAVVAILAAFGVPNARELPVPKRGPFVAALTAKTEELAVA
jgi:hypothetical protein